MSSAHPFDIAFNEMIEAFGGQWPLRPSFENWPQSFSVYQQITDEMPFKLAEFNNAKLFRRWLCNELETKVDLERVMLDLEDHLSFDNKILLGFLSALAFLSCAYRWGTVHSTEEEKMRVTLIFAKEIWTPFEKLSDFYGFAPMGNVFSLFVGNGIYEDDKPVDMRFRFNSDPEIHKTEKNFFLPPLQMETMWKPGLHLMAEYLTLTELARQSREDAETLLVKRVNLLKELRNTLMAITSLFRSSMKEVHLSPKYWADHVQFILAWNINGRNGGATGIEFMQFSSLDMFLGITGEGGVFKSSLERRVSMPRSYRKCLDALTGNSLTYRFDSFLDIHEDPLLQGKNDLISMLYMWRLSHAKVAEHFMSNSRMTAAGSIDKVLVAGESLAKRAGEELKERARETSNCLTVQRRSNQGDGQLYVVTSVLQILRSLVSRVWAIFAAVLK